VLEEEGRLTVTVPNGSSFAQDRLKDVANRELVNETARRLFSAIRDVSLMTGTPSGGLEAPAHPAIQAAIELFEGEITQVRAAPGSRPSASAEPAGGGGEAP
jgi:hypothetical protein